ncbi:MAG: Ig-like domain-containing protein [Methylobacterium sp.]|uniref:Ig-like domain-containing protein n=1 Tax=Methylobacterium sp. TaxID=409 RepID=UPI002722CBEF|nr:Ig-like domain-containing protein [Methylobacterium sp.]MDO9429297.1 Ig-like domain-containing protein [Methylobacterium sp.]
MITTPAGLTNDATPTITGTAEAGATVTVSNNGTVLGTALVGTNGQFSFTPTVSLADGNNILTARATDAAGNVGMGSTSVTLVITAPPSTGDTTAPDVPVLDGLLPTNDTTPTISGTAEPGATVIVSNNTTQIGSAVADSDGRFNLTPAVLPEGTASLTAVAVDAAGNVSSVSTPTLVLIDTTAPGVPVFDALAPTKDTTPTITGTAEAGATVTILDNGTVLGTAVAGTNGQFSFTPTVPLAVGSNVITATAQDPAGNSSASSAPVTVLIDAAPAGGGTVSPGSSDTTAPPAPVLTALPAPTNDTTPTFTGTAEAGSTVTILNGGAVLGVAVANSNGAFSFTPTAPLADGTTILTAIATDAAGNVSPSSGATSVVIDTAAPATPTVSPISGPTANTTPTITGAAEAGATVTIIDNGTMLGTAVADGNGAFSFTPTAPLAVGSNIITATAQDPAGNSSTDSAPVTVVIVTTPPGGDDTIAPPAPILTAFPGPTNDATPTITGTAEAGSTVTIISGTTLLGTAVVGIDGSFSLTPTTPLGAGNNIITATARDLAGNSSTSSAALILVVDMAVQDGGNLAPEPLKDVIATVTHSAAVTGNLLANDSDPNAGDVLHVTAVRFSGGITVDVPSEGTVTVLGDHGTLHLAADGRYSYQAIGSSNLSTDAHVAELFTYTVSDGKGLSAQAGLAVSLDGATPAAEASFGFAFTEARVERLGETLVLTGPDGVPHDIGGIASLHFADGSIQQDDGHALVDDVWYLAHNLDVWKAGVDADTHYETYGWHEGRDPNAYFSTQTYLGANPDVAAAGVNPLEHYAQYGEHEGRSPSPDFSGEAYLAQYSDVAASGENALEHYLHYGLGEGRNVQDGKGSAGHIGAFDPAFYLAENPDVAAVAAEAGPFTLSAPDYAFHHYVTYGADEGRAPNALFDPDFYLSANPDVAASGLNPLLHYEEYGWREGRDPGPGFDTNAYLEHNPDVAAADIDPLQHFLDFGMKEGRLPV